MSIPRASIWPNVVFTTNADTGMADARAWSLDIFASEDPTELFENLEAIALASGVRLVNVEFRRPPDGPVSPVEPRESANSTQGPRDANQDTQPASFQAAANYLSRAPQPGAIGLLEAALAEARGASRPLPPPKPGTHESDPIFRGIEEGPCLTCGPDICADDEHQGGWIEYKNARRWSKSAATEGHA